MAPTRHADAPSTWVPWAEVDYAALRDNAAWFRRRLGSRRRFYAVVKARAYGHGIEVSSRAALAGGANGLAVAHVEEGVEARTRAPASAPVLVFAPALPSQAGALHEYGLTATVTSRSGVRSLGAAARRLGVRLPVQVNVDTGMGRLGAWCAEAGPLIEDAAGHPCLELDGVYSHLACADEDAAFTRTQVRRFLELRDAFAGRVPCWHLANSAAMLLDESTFLDGARVGIAFYGADPGPGVDLPPALRPALCWRARITYIKRIARGRSISYGATFVAPRSMAVATVAAGYADGYPRIVSNRAAVLVRGKRCPVLGRVTMDQIVVDGSAIPGLRPGDPVTLIGADGSECIRAGEVAAWANTISYEVLTGISSRVRRVVVNDAAGNGKDAT